MPFQTISELRYFVFDSLNEGLVHAIFTRQGGVSPPPWASLNLGGTVGDDPVRVSENRARLFSVLHRDPSTLYDVWQVHSSGIAIAHAPRSPQSTQIQADGILTDNPNVTLMMRFADCVPIIFFDPQRRVVGIAHAGWLGTVHGIVRIVIETMQKKFGTNPADVFAAIGPSICRDHYEVGLDVVAQVKRAFGKESSQVLAEINGGTHFDLWEANRLLLLQAGVDHVEVAGLCTACHLNDWYSYRAENGRTGRFGAMIWLT